MGAIPQNLAQTAGALACAVALAAGCTSPAPLPPQFGDCDACAPAGSVGGGGGGAQGAGASASGACVTSATDSQCTQCENLSCCTELGSCAASLPCKNLSNCELTCEGVATCLSACEALYPAGVIALAAVTTCLDQSCPVCSQLGIGDPCSTGTCNPGLTCGSNLWCTVACTLTSACAGLGTNAGNALGNANACTLGPNGNACAPGCMTSTDCASFPGTFCVATTSVDGLAVSVCSALPEAGL